MPEAFMEAAVVDTTAVDGMPVHAGNVNAVANEADKPL